MELIKFNSKLGPSYLLDAEPINGVTSVSWTERYRAPGEFKIEAPLSSGLKSYLPLGAIISHVDSIDAMVVENHQIKDEPDKDPIIQISGRSLISFLEHRIVGSDEDWDSHDNLFAEYILAAEKTWTQIVTLINDHILDAVAEPGNVLPNIIADTLLSGASVSEERVLKRGTVLQRVLELLQIEDLGIRTVRRNTFSSVAAGDYTYFLVHKGVDRSDDVIFSWYAGDITDADYLWSNKAYKNAALVTGRYVETAVVPPSVTGYNRRWLLVEASDLDDYFESAPAGLDLQAVLAKMEVRGNEALLAQKEINITSSNFSTNVQYKFRRDFDIGDIVSIYGNFGEIEKRRIVEFIEIEDENGESSYPTLEVLP